MRADLPPTPDWLQRIIRIIGPLLPREFVGQIEINVINGGISNVNLKQSYREEWREQSGLSGR